MVPAPLSGSQESNWRMDSARSQEHYVTRRIPRTPTFCRLRPEDAKCRSTSSRVCAGVSKRTATLSITETKRRVSSLREAVRDPASTTVPMASSPACLSARSAGAPAGRQKKKLKLAPPQEAGRCTHGQRPVKMNRTQVDAVQSA